MENTAVVLFQTSLSENIGTTARAAANMGIGSLIVVDPYRFEEDIIRAVATKTAESLVDRIVVKENLREALADFNYVVGTTARRGGHRGPFYSPRTMAEKLVDLSHEGKVALLFGPERSGLTNAELRLCQAVVRIPTADPKSSSLNLAQAVLILAYELFLTSSNQKPAPKIKPAPMSDILAMYDHFSETMVKIGFLPEDNTDHWLMNFKKIFNRSGLTHGECNLIRGMCRQINWAIKTGGRPDVSSILTETDQAAEG